VAGNWKMHPGDRGAAVGLATAVAEHTASVGGEDGVEVVVCPPSIWIRDVAAELEGTGVGVGAQTMHAEDEGAFTGEVSPRMLAGVARYVIVGHSERRRLFGESDEWVKLKLGATLAAGLEAIVCIGETLAEREQGRTLEVLDRQLATGLEAATSEQVATLVVAYEPVWAIGTGRNATPEQADEAHRHIRSRLVERYGAQAANHCRILYGGSVKADNIRALIDLPDVDGALVGGASLEALGFGEIVRRAGGA
jgi:triosephosphate isomerase